MIKRKLFRCWFVGLLAVATALGTPAQVAPDTSSVAADPDIIGTAVVDIGAHHQTTQITRVVTEEDGTVSTNVGSYTTLASGMHYLDAQGKWQTSVAQFDLVNGQGVASQTGHKVVLTGSPTDPEPVDITLPDGRHIVNRCYGLSFYDAASGKSVLLAEPRATQGFLSGDKTEVTYVDCFDGLKADLRYRLSIAGIEADVILHEGPPDPSNFGFDPKTCRFEVVTELLKAPVPVVLASVVREETDPQQRAVMADPDLINEDYDFGTMYMVIGRAFTLENDLAAGFQAPSVPVAKHIETISGRNMLFESVNFSEMDLLFKDLPKAQANRKSKDALRVVSNRRDLLPVTHSPVPSGSSLLLAYDRSRLSGVAIDYTLVQGTNANSYGFLANTTYLITNLYYVANTAFFEGGTVVKFSTDENPGVSPVLWIQGLVIAPLSGDQFTPMVLTSKHDNTIGEQIPGSTGNAPAHVGGLLKLEWTNTFNLNTGLVKYLDGIQFARNCSATFRNWQFLNCRAPVSTLLGGNITVGNVLIIGTTSNVFVNYDSNPTSISVSGEHATIAQAPTLVVKGTVALTNSLLATVTNTNGYSGAFSQIVNPATAFQTVGAGAFYLLDNTLRNAGTNIGGQTGLDITTKTTYPPTVVTNDITTNTTWSQTVQRDTDMPDLGFHYNPIDYAVANRSVTGATLLITNGCVVAAYNDSALQPNDGGKVIAEGSPTKLVRFIRYHQAQEESNTNWMGNVGAVWRTFKEKYTSGTRPTIELRFAGLPLLASGGARITGINKLSTFSAKDCIFYGGSLVSQMTSFSDMTIALTNSVFDHVDLQLGPLNNNNMTVYARNNLFFIDTKVTVNAVTPNSWEWRDNYFWTIDIVQGGTSFTNSHDAYTLGNVLNGSQGGDLTFVAGLMGAGYYPGSLCVLALADKGSRSASAAGLYHYRLGATDPKEANSTVDIGFHHVVLDGAGQPFDTDSDGLPDYIEDRNGNGIVDPGEADWMAAGLKVFITEPKNNSNIP